jgi:hypothetical protein
MASRQSEGKMAGAEFNLYEFPDDHVGRKRYVSVRGHSRSIPVDYTYKGSDGRNYIHPDFGGDWTGYSIGSSTPQIMKDIEPYRCPLDNSMVTSRSHRREQMRKHGVIEVGTEVFKTKRSEAPMPRAGHDIVRAMEQLRGR